MRARWIRLLCAVLGHDWLTVQTRRCRMCERCYELAPMDGTR